MPASTHPYVGTGNLLSWSPMTHSLLDHCYLCYERHLWIWWAITPVIRLFGTADFKKAHVSSVGLIQPQEPFKSRCRHEGGREIWSMRNSLSLALEMERDTWQETQVAFKSWEQPWLRAKKEIKISGLYFQKLNSAISTWTWKRTLSGRW